MAMLVGELIDRGWRCELFVLEPNGPLRQKLEARGVVIRNGGFDSTATKPQKFLLLLRALFRLMLLVRNIKPSVIHAYLPLTNFMGALAGRIMNVPKVITSRRALGTHQDRHQYWKLFDRTANFLSDHVTVNSRAVWDDTVRRDGIDPRKLVHIANGLDTSELNKASQRRESIRRSLGLDDSQLAIVAVGNLIPYKGHSDLINAVPKILKIEPSAMFFLVGEDRGVGAALQSQARDLGVSANVLFLGRRDDVADVLAAMDVFVLPSHEEGFSNALLEAMASGLAIVATDVGGNGEALDRGRLGILVPSRNSDELAVAVINLVTNAAERRRLGQIAKAHVHTNYSVVDMVNAHVKLYES